MRYSNRNISNFLLSATGMVLYAGSSLAATSQVKKTKEPNIKGQISPDLDTRFQGGNKRNIGSFNFFVPLAQDSVSLLFMDARLVGDSKYNKEGNLGLIYRYQLGGDIVVGGGPFIDVRHSSTDNTFTQLTLNAHFLTSTWQVQGNVYLAQNKKKISHQKISQTNQVIPLQGYQAAIVGNRAVTYERALSGLDLHVSYAHPALTDLRVGGTAYRFSGKGFKAVQGFGQSLQYRVSDVVKLDVEHNRDGVRKSNFYAGITLTIPLSEVPKRKAHPSKIDRLFTTRVIRDIDAVTVERKEELKEVVGTFTGIFVDPNAPPGGNGTKEAPYQVAPQTSGSGLAVVNSPATSFYPSAVLPQPALPVNIAQQNVPAAAPAGGGAQPAIPAVPPPPLPGVAVGTTRQKPTVPPKPTHLQMANFPPPPPLPSVAAPPVIVAQSAIPAAPSLPGAAVGVVRQKPTVPPKPAHLQMANFPPPPPLPGATGGATPISPVALVQPAALADARSAALKRLSFISRGKGPSSSTVFSKSILQAPPAATEAETSVQRDDGPAATQFVPTALMIEQARERLKQTKNADLITQPKASRAWSNEEWKELPLVTSPILEKANSNRLVSTDDNSTEENSNEWK